MHAASQDAVGRGHHTCSQSQSLLFTVRMGRFPPREIPASNIFYHLPLRLLGDHFSLLLPLSLHCVSLEPPPTHLQECPYFAPLTYLRSTVILGCSLCSHMTFSVVFPEVTPHTHKGCKSQALLLGVAYDKNK